MRLLSPDIPFVLIGLALTPGFAQETPASPPGGPPVITGFGLAVRVDDFPEALRSPSAETPCWVRLTATRADLEDPRRLAAGLDEARARGLKVLVRLADADWQPVEAWFGRLQGLARATAGWVDAWQLFGPDGPMVVEPHEYAYLLKQARVALRSGGSEASVVSAPLPTDDPGWIDSLFEEDAAPYLDAVAASDPGSLAAVIRFRDRLHAHAPIWITDAPIGAERPGAAAVRDALESLVAGAQVVLFEAGPPAEVVESPVVEPAAAEPAPAEATSSEAAPPEAAPPPAPRPAAVAPRDAAARALVAARALLPRGLQPAAAGALPFDPDSGIEGGEVASRLPVPLRALAFFDPATRDGLAIYRPPSRPAGDGEPAPAPRLVRLRLRQPLERLDLIDPATGIESHLADATPPGALVDLPLRPGAMVLRYRIAATALPINEEARVGAIAELTAEEIIAREREMRGIEATRYSHYEASATISIHYRLAALRETVDLVTENRLFVKGDRQDYQQTAMYVNGALWRGKEPPYLPYLQPGTVTEVPLDIRLDERYRYRLEGRETIDGQDCYVIGFEPAAADSTESLYRGKVMIDARRFTRVKMAVVQTNLSDPMRSNEVVYRFAPVTTKNGEVWLPRTVIGQMNFELLGYSLAVEREMAYADYRADDEGFEERREAAYASGRPLFRDTGGTFHKLTREAGVEALQPLDSPRNTLFVFGISAGEEGDLSFPFAGVNWFDFDFRGSGTQFNLAWAGPFCDISWNQPNLLGSGREVRPWSLAVQGTFNALEVEDKNATSAGTFEADEVAILRETVRATMAIPVGDFLRFSLETRATYQNFDRKDDTDPGFVLPPTNIEPVVNLRGEFARLGWLFALWGEWGRRSDWAAWGLPGQRFEEDDRDFTRVGADLRKSFFFGIYNKLSFGVSGFEGRSLDRFSRFELGDFRSARVRGFNGSGIHFDRGLMGEASYAFPLGRHLRADVSIQEGFVHSGDDFGDGYERILGSGLSLEFSGPWSTFVNVRLSRALSSTIEDKGGKGDMRIVFFRTFDKWSRKGGNKRPPPVPVQPPAPGDPAGIPPE